MNNNTSLFKVLFLAGTLFGATTAFADDDNDFSSGVTLDCSTASAPYLSTVLNLPPFSNSYGSVNNTVCIDVPVNLTKSKVVFSINNNVAGVGVDGNGNSNGLKHLVMLGTVIKNRIANGLIKPDEVSIIGILHGSAIGWGTKNTNQANWINQIFQLQQDGVNIQLELCGVTMLGAGMNNGMIYTDPNLARNGKIHVNQGAIARIMYLEQRKHVYMHE